MDKETFHVAVGLEEQFPGGRADEEWTEEFNALQCGEVGGEEFERRVVELAAEVKSE